MNLAKRQKKHGHCEALTSTYWSDIVTKVPLAPQTNLTVVFRSWHHNCGTLANMKFDIVVFEIKSLRENVNLLEDIVLIS